MKKAKYIDGILVLYQNNRANKASYAEFGILSGAFNEKIDGTAHFLEHMLFNGTPSLTKQDIIKNTKLLGINASTSFDKMIINFQRSSRKLEDCFKICSDMFFNSNLDKTMMENERKVILEEFNKVKSDMITQATLKHRAKVFNCKKFNFSPLGHSNSILKITTKDLEKFKKENFCKENFYVSICSNKSFAYCKKLIKKYIIPNLKSIPNFTAKHSFDKPIQQKSFVQILPSNDFSQNTFFLSLNTTNISRKNDHILGYLNQIQKSRFTNILRHKQGLVYNSPTSYCAENLTEMRYGLQIKTTAKNIKNVLTELAKIFNDLKTNGITKEEYESTKELDLLLNDSSLPNPSKRPGSNITDYRYFKKLISGKQSQKEFHKIKLEEINNFLKELFDINQVALTVVGNASKKDVPSLSKLKQIFGVKY